MKFKIGVPLRQAIHPSIGFAPKTRTLVLVSLAFGFLARGAPAAGGPVGSLLAADAGYQVVERGQNFALFRKVTATTADAGYTVFRTNQFILLENGLHYLENGQWNLSEDIVESFSGGAIARQPAGSTTQTSSSPR